MIIEYKARIIYEIIKPHEYAKRNNDKKHLKDLGYKLIEAGTTMHVAEKKEGKYVEITPEGEMQCKDL